MVTRVERYRAAMARLRAAASAGVGQAWDDLPGYDDADVGAFLAAAIPIVSAAQSQAVVMTDGYVAAELGRSPVGLDPATLTGAAVRNGTDPETVYRRSFVGLWHALAEGTMWEDAVKAARSRAVATAATDVALSARSAAVAAGGRAGVSGWRRMPDANACKFCLLAAGQRYKTDQLMPLHANCGCAVQPMVGSRPPAPKSLDLSARDVQLAVHEHAELGPVITDANHEFTELIRTPAG